MDSLAPAALVSLIKDLHFGKSTTKKMLRSAGKKLAHNSTIPLSMGGANELRPLQDLISAEKVAMTSFQRASADIAKVAETLRTWGIDEAQGEDLADTATAACLLLTHYAHALTSFANYHNPVREYLKNLRTSIENLHSLKAQLRSLKSKSEASEKRLARMSPEHKKLQQETDTLNRLTAEILEMEAQVQREEKRTADMKREETRRVLATTFGGLIEASEKGKIVGQMGKVVAAEIPIAYNDHPRGPYQGRSNTAAVLEQTQQQISSIGLDVSLPGPEPQLAPPPTSWAAPIETATYHSHDDDQALYSPTQLSPAIGAHMSQQPSPPISPTRSQLSGSPSQCGRTYPSTDYLHSSSITGPVDDFGVNVRDSDKSPTGSRFATFPNVSAVSPQLHNQPQPHQYTRTPPPRLNTDENDDDFAASVENALSGVTQHKYSPPPGPPPPQDNTQVGSDYVQRRYVPPSGPLPSHAADPLHYHGHARPQYAPPAGPPPPFTHHDSFNDVNDETKVGHYSLAPRRQKSQEGLRSPWDKRVPSSLGGSAEDVSSGLAYMSHEHDDEDTKHVTFENGKDVDIEGELVHARRSQEARASSGDHGTSHSQLGIRRSATPSEEEERALDAAAARRLSAQVSSMVPPVPPKDPSPSASPYPIHMYQEEDLDDAPPSPQRLTGRRSLSGINTREIPSDSPRNASPASPLRNAAPLSSSSSGHDTLTSLLDRPPPSVAIPSTPTPEPPSATPPFRTPLSTPTNILPPSIRSSPLPPPSGARTISAAAFKRQPRSTSFSSPESSDVTPPVTLRKRLGSQASSVPLTPQSQPHDTNPRVDDYGHDGFDYVGAYSYGGDNGERQTTHQQGAGYASGNFTTNLENNLR